jgi:hypothetical protein
LASDENNKAAAYLAALKQTRPEAAGAAQAPEHATGDMAQENRAGSYPGDRRRSIRYKCQGSAHLREFSTGIGTWATFTDISLNGCYIEAASSFRVGAQLELTLELDGFRLDTRAEVRVVYPGLGMGIAFRGISSADRERLWNLLRTLGRPAPIRFQRIGVTTAAAIKANNTSPQPDPALTLKAISDFFEQRQMLSRDEFLRILRYLPKQGT